MEVVTVGLKGSQEQFDNRSQWVDPAPQVTAPAGADAEQPAEVEQMYSEILRSTQNTGSGRQQQMAAARQPGYYGPQPGQDVRQGPLQEAAGSRGHHHRQQQSENCREWQQQQKSKGEAECSRSGCGQQQSGEEQERIGSVT